MREEVASSRRQDSQIPIIAGLERAPDLRLLNEFVGIWDISGTNEAQGSGEKQEKVVGTETYEWLTGDYFLIYRWDRTFETGHHKGFGVFGFDGKTSQYYARNFDNLGFSRLYTVTLAHRRIDLQGETEKATLRVSEDNTMLDVHWEMRTEEGKWSTLCELVGRRTH